MRIPELDIPYLPQWQHMTNQQTQEHLQQLAAQQQQLMAQQQQQLMAQQQQQQQQQQMAPQQQGRPQPQQQVTQQLRQRAQQMAQQRLRQLRMNQQQLQQQQQVRVQQQQQQPKMDQQQQAAMLLFQRQIGQQRQVAISQVPSNTEVHVRPQNPLHRLIVPQSQTPNQGNPSRTPTDSHPHLQQVHEPLSTSLQRQQRPHSTPKNLLEVNNYENSNPPNSSSSNQQQQQQSAYESSNSLMGSDLRQIFCKYCGQKCVKRASDSVDNPGRVFWACPIQLGGHGWMEWEDYELPSDTKQNESMNEKVVRLERMLQDRECELIECKIEKVRIT